MAASEASPSSESALRAGWPSASCPSSPPPTVSDDAAASSPFPALPSVVVSLCTATSASGAASDDTPADAHAAMGTRLNANASESSTVNAFEARVAARDGARRVVDPDMRKPFSQGQCFDGRFSDLSAATLRMRPCLRSYGYWYSRGLAPRFP